MQRTADGRGKYYQKEETLMKRSLGLQRSTHKRRNNERVFGGVVGKPNLGTTHRLRVDQRDLWGKSGLKDLGIKTHRAGGCMAIYIK